MSVRGAAVRQFLPAGWRGVLRWDCSDGVALLIADNGDGPRGYAMLEGEWKWAADTSPLAADWTGRGYAADYASACEDMAAHLRAAGFEVPPRPEAT